MSTCYGRSLEGLAVCEAIFARFPSQDCDFQLGNRAPLLRILPPFPFRGGRLVCASPFPKFPALQLVCSKAHLLHFLVSNISQQHTPNLLPSFSRESSRLWPPHRQLEYDLGHRC